MKLDEIVYNDFIFNSWRRVAMFWDKEGNIIRWGYSRGKLPTDEKKHPSWPYACYPVEKVLADPHGLTNWGEFGLSSTPRIVDLWIMKVAVKHKGEIFSLYPPNRHHNCIKLILDTLEVPESECPIGGGPEAQGFVTNFGDFVNRKEACKIAEDAGQIMIKTGPEDILFSEDIW